VDDAIVGRVIDECVEPLLSALRRRRVDYRGVLYAGLMLTADGPKVLEFNVRFGDPETQVIVPRTSGDLTEILFEAASGNLRGQAPAAEGASVCVVLASEGYPDAVRTGDPISGLEEARCIKGVTIMNAAVRGEANALVTSGGRVLGITGTADSLSSARKLAYEAVACVSWEGMHHRHDIAALDAEASDSGSPL
jgi:phosphoribosylamine---glycine ligase